jgi:hypothetical protein
LIIRSVAAAAEPVRKLVGSDQKTGRNQFKNRGQRPVKAQRMPASAESMGTPASLAAMECEKEVAIDISADTLYKTHALQIA